MARKYPRFLLANPSNTKSSGPFIIHTLEPRFISTPKFDEQRNLIHSSLLEAWTTDYDIMEVHKIMHELPQWYKHSGIYQSNHEDDQVLSAVYQMDFLQEYTNPFTVEEVRELIRALFPTKSKSIYRMSNSYGLKHLFERITWKIIPTRGAKKYCSNDTAIEAFQLEGFQSEKCGPDSPNWFMNISVKDLKRANRLFRI
jgi:hypothetical protein